eukprot:g2878.t1
MGDQNSNKSVDDGTNTMHVLHHQKKIIDSHLDYLSVAIDLGTSNSVLAVCDSRTNQVNVLDAAPNNRSNPKLLCSVVGYHENGERIVGCAALDDMEEYFKGNTFLVTKRMLGRRYEDSVVQQVLACLPCRKNTSKRLKSSSTDESTGGVQFRIVASGHPREYLVPEQINAAIISHLLEVVEKHYEGFTVAGYENIWESPKTVVVVCVPANYDAAQRSATRHAMEIAGISPRSIHLINEPTAAAIAHRDSYASSPPEHLTLLVYDFGGGTVDVTIVQIGFNQLEWLEKCREVFIRAGRRKRKMWSRLLEQYGENLHSQGSNYKKQVAEKLLAEALHPQLLPEKSVGISVCAVEGSSRLGGHDFTGVVLEVIMKKLKKRCRGTYLTISDEEMDRLLFHDEFRARLYRKCEEAKIALSIKKSTTVLIHLRALKTIIPDTPGQQFVRLLTNKVVSAEVQAISKIYKVTKDGQLRSIILKLTIKSDPRSGVRRYVLKWPSRFPLTRNYSVDMSTIVSFGIGAGYDAPDLMHVIRSDVSSRAELDHYFWIHCRDDGSVDDSSSRGKSSNCGGRRSPRSDAFALPVEQSYCFYARDRVVVKRWVEAFREVYGTPAERRERREMTAIYETTEGTVLHEETITRSEFERGGASYQPRGLMESRNLWEECIEPITDSLSAARMHLRDIDQVLFVGGTTFTPKIREIVGDFFPKSASLRRDRVFGAPVVAVASGAARFGATLCSHMSGRVDMMVTEVISRSLGLTVKTKSGSSSMLHMVRKGEYLPFVHAARFHPVHGFPTCDACHCPVRCMTLKCKNPCKLLQEECAIEIFEGESEQCEVNMHNRRLGEFCIDLTKFDPAITDPAKIGITVEFLLGCERDLTVTASAHIDEGERCEFTHRLNVTRTEDLVLQSREVRHMRRIEEYYVALEKSRALMSPVRLPSIDCSSEESEADLSDGVIFDSDDDELFRSPTLTPGIQTETFGSNKRQSGVDIAAIM